MTRRKCAPLNPALDPNLNPGGLADRSKTYSELQPKVSLRDQHLVGAEREHPGGRSEAAEDRPEGSETEDAPRGRHGERHGEVGQRIDFKTLGYPDDPAITGGRFFLKLGRGTPPQ